MVLKFRMLWNDSIFSFSEVILSDPTGEEESLSSARLSVVTDGETIFSVHKPGELHQLFLASKEILTIPFENSNCSNLFRFQTGGSTLSESQLQDCLATAKERANLVNEMICTATR